ncbi:hypothetical protein [Wenxinia marina]|uniref:Uncharacterized protein n=1 Tax=Wenxinia marina DSM 24838 TaxID=1123501 RepID=A0A0D0QFS9_9RHOB|nr:hypothetical protein [Wenxinia marina]KIQ69888.1 hypothetical protein Wenmar_01458 [Wenxinia marina DSM 24838]GGL61999.1 hypothetical protein GCM10011392_15610 [Wenxinia marina]
MHRFVLPFALVLAAPALAQSQDDIDAYLAAAAEQGCVLTAETSLAIEEATGFDRPTIQAIEEALAADLVVVDASTIRVTAGPCG